MVDSVLSWLLLPLGAALGWAWARRRGGEEAPRSREQAVASLADDDSDQAVAALSHAADADPAAAELQLTLGGLFRRRGELDRAIRLHETLLARTDLPRKVADAARIELAQDYLKAGLLDRAEELLQGMEGESPQLAAALELLLDLYEQARDWPQALDAARRTTAASGTVIWNLAPVPARMSREMVSELLAATSHLLVNEHEALDAAAAIDLAASDYEAAAAALAKAGNLVCIVTAGAQGALAVTADGTRLRALAPDITPVDTTGAGDTFAGALAAMIHEKVPLQTALEVGCEAAAQKCLKPGAQAGMPLRGAIAALA